MTIQIKQKGEGEKKTYYLVIDSYVIAFGTLKELYQIANKPLKIRRG